MTSEQERQEAADHLANRMDDIRAFLALDDKGVTVYEDTDANEDVGTVYDYGLSWERYLTNHRDQTRTYVHVLSTGGPHEEFHVTYDEDGDVVSVTFVYLPWFGRVDLELSAEDEEAARDFYQRFYFVDG